MFLQHSKIKLEVIPLKKGLSNFATWKDSFTRYLKRKKAQHLVHRAYNRTTTMHQPDTNRPIHHLLATVAKPAQRAEAEFDEMDEYLNGQANRANEREAGLMPDIPELKTPGGPDGQIPDELRELDEAERRFLSDTNAYMDPRTGKPETEAQETLRYVVWAELANSLFYNRALINNVQEGNIHTVLTRLCRAYQPATMTYLDTMEALAKIKKTPAMTIADLQGEIHALVEKRRLDTQQEVSDTDKKAAILKACKHDNNYSQFVRMLSLTAKNENYDWVVASLEEYEMTETSNNENRNNNRRRAPTRFTRYNNNKTRRERAHQTGERQKKRAGAPHSSTSGRPGQTRPRGKASRARGRQERANSAYPHNNNKANATCYNCGKKGHFKFECKQPRKEQAAQAREQEAENNEEDLADMFRFDEQANSARERRRPRARTRKQARREPANMHAKQNAYERNEQVLRQQLTNKIAEKTHARLKRSLKDKQVSGKNENEKPQSKNAWAMLTPEQKQQTTRRVEIALKARRTWDNFVQQHRTLNLDSGSAFHYLHPHLFDKYASNKRAYYARIESASDNKLYADTVGDVRLPINDTGHTLTMKQARRVPGITESLCSPRLLAQLGITTTITKDGMLLRYNDEELVRVNVLGGMYPLVVCNGQLKRWEDALARTDTPPERLNLARTYLGNLKPEVALHNKLGHAYVHGGWLRRAIKHTFNITPTGAQMCMGCAQAKMHKFKHERECENRRKPADAGTNFHLDTMQMPVFSKDGYRYLCTVYDEGAAAIDVVTTRTKSEEAEQVINTLTQIQNNYGRKIKQVRTDGGLEFKGVQRWCEENKIRFELSCPYEPEQNGQAENANKILLHGGEACRIHAGLPRTYWSYACRHFAYTHKRLPTIAGVPTKTLTTPLEKREGRTLDWKKLVSWLHPFGCLVSVRVPKEKLAHTHLEHKGLPALMLGYSENKKGYIVQLLGTGKIIDGIYNCSFDETRYPMLKYDPNILHIFGKQFVEDYKKEKKESGELDIDYDVTISDNENTNNKTGPSKTNNGGSKGGEVPTQPRRSSRAQTKAWKHYKDSRTYVRDPAKPKSDTRDGKAYEIEEIVDSAYDEDGNLIYKIKWKGYSARRNTWQQAADVDAPELVTDFHDAYPDKPIALRKEEEEKANMFKENVPPMNQINETLENTIIQDKLTLGGGMSPYHNQLLSRLLYTPVKGLPETTNTDIHAREHKSAHTQPPPSPMVKLLKKRAISDQDRTGSGNAQITTHTHTNTQSRVSCVRGQMCKILGATYVYEPQTKNFLRLYNTLTGPTTVTNHCVSINVDTTSAKATNANDFESLVGSHTQKDVPLQLNTAKIRLNEQSKMAATTAPAIPAAGSTNFAKSKKFGLATKDVKSQNHCEKSLSWSPFQVREPTEAKTRQTIKKRLTDRNQNQFREFGLSNSPSVPSEEIQGADIQAFERPLVCMPPALPLQDDQQNTSRQQKHNLNTAYPGINRRTPSDETMPLDMPARFDTTNLRNEVATVPAIALTGFHDPLLPKEAMMQLRWVTRAHGRDTELTPNTHTTTRLESMHVSSSEPQEKACSATEQSHTRRLADRNYHPAKRYDRSRPRQRARVPLRVVKRKDKATRHTHANTQSKRKPGRKPKPPEKYYNRPRRVHTHRAQPGFRPTNLRMKRVFADPVQPRSVHVHIQLMPDIAHTHTHTHLSNSSQSKGQRKGKSLYCTRTRIQHQGVPSTWIGLNELACTTKA